MRLANARPFRTLAAAVCGLVVVTAPARGEDWPRWRGPRGDGTWQGPKLPDRWPDAGLKRVWKQPVGGGYAGVIVADGRVYTADLESPVVPKKEGPGSTERVLCFNAADGKPLWSHRYPVRYGTLGGYNNGPRAAPTFHDDRLYTLGAVGHLFCFDAATGRVLWSKDMVREYRARVPEWGFAASPVIEGRTVIVHTGAEPDGCYIAFDRITGSEVWRSGTDPAGYCTPALADVPGGRQLIGWTPEHVCGLDAATGRQLWQVPYKVTYGVSIATPVVRDDIVLVTGYWEGAKAVRLGPKPGDHKLIWEDRRNLRGVMAQPLYRDGYVYALDRQSGLTCFELQTGKKLWDDGNTMTPGGRNPHASFVWLGDGDRILSLNSDGELVLARLSPKGYVEQSRARALAGKAWSHPAFAGRFLFVRSDGGEGMGKGPFELSCVELAGQ